MSKLIIKLGTSSLFDEGSGEHKLANMAQLVEQVVKLRAKGYKVVLVSSGGIAAGVRRLKLGARPSQKHLSALRAVAGTGQARLIGLWDDLFRQFDVPVAQVLLTRNDINDRAQYQNAASTINQLLEMGAVPIVNENDTLSSYEIRFGDNDTLSAITAAMVGADQLFLLTDVDCLYTSNPRIDPNAKPIRRVQNVHDIKTDATTSQGSGVGTGGMTTKLIAANLATSAGIATYVCRSFTPGIVFDILHDIEQGVAPADSQFLYTLFVPHVRDVIHDRAFWLLHGLADNGSITVDQGAFKALKRRNRAGLLPIGVIAVQGHFHASECVKIYAEGIEEPVGRCLVNYSAIELERIKKQHSHAIEELLGYSESEYVAFRDNLALYPELKEH